MLVELGTREEREREKEREIHAHTHATDTHSGTDRKTLAGNTGKHQAMAMTKKIFSFLEARIMSCVLKVFVLCLCMHVCLFLCLHLCVQGVCVCSLCVVCTNSL